MKEKCCVIMVTTSYALKMVLDDPVSAVFVDEMLLDDETEAVMHAHGYCSGLVGWTGKLFLRQDFDYEKYDLTDALETLGIQPKRLHERMRS